MLVKISSFYSISFTRNECIKMPNFDCILAYFAIELHYNMCYEENGHNKKSS